MHLVLMGLRCSGKSTAGPGVAAALGWGFLDLDDVVASLAGDCGKGGVGGVLVHLGERQFRVLESEALRGVLQDRPRTPRVLALGGGTPTAPGAAMRLQQARLQGDVRCVYLRAQPATLKQRLAVSGAAGRPALTGGNAVDEVAVLFMQRDPLYISLADGVIEVDSLSTEQLVERIVTLVRAWLGQ